MNLDLAKITRLPLPDNPSTEWQRAEGLEIERARATDHLVADLAEFLGVLREQVFALAQAEADGSIQEPARLCGRALAQLTERTYFNLLSDVFVQGPVAGLLDYGAGGGSVSLPFAHAAGAVLVVDEAGPSLRFATWRMARYGASQAMALDTMQARSLPAGAVPVVLCWLAHADPLASLAKLVHWLAPGGLMLLGDSWTPWRRALAEIGMTLAHEERHFTVAVKPS